jgi:hypothetical protein
VNKSKKKGRARWCWQRTPSQTQPNNDKDPGAYLGGGFPRRVSTPPQEPPGVMLTLTSPRMPRKGTSPNNLAGATPQTEDALPPPPK